MTIHLSPGPASASPSTGSGRSSATPVGEPVEPTARDVFLPIIAGSPPVTPPPDPILLFYGLLISDPRQERPRLERCPALVISANWRAAGFVAGEPWAHCDAAGACANDYARRAGCVLPVDYDPKGNNIESLVAGTANAVIAFNALAESPKHSNHLFGRGDFFRRQTHVGIAMAAGGVYGWYWVIHIGLCEGAAIAEPVEA